MKAIEFTIPLKLVSSLNSRVHWAVRAKTVKRERSATALAARQALRNVQPVVRVTLTRVGPRTLDSDNLAAVSKATRDEIARTLRIDDGSPLIDWQYRQEKGEYGVKVLVEPIQPLSWVMVE